MKGPDHNPDICTSCQKPIYGTVRYCPYCGIARQTAHSTTTTNKENKAFLATEKSSLPDHRQEVLQTPEESTAKIHVLEPSKENDPSSDPISANQKKTENRTSEKINRYDTKTTTLPKKNIALALVIAGIVVIAGFLIYNSPFQSSRTPPQPEIENQQEPAEENVNYVNARRIAEEAAIIEVERIAKEMAVEKAELEAERERIEREKKQAEFARVQAEIQDYLTQGQILLGNGKYERCIDKMKEVLKRDPSNRKAMTIKRTAQNKLDDVWGKFSNPDVRPEH